MREVRLIHHPEDLAVVRLDAHAVVPEWAMAEAPLVSVSLTRAETSVICLAAAVPRGVRQEGPFQVFEVGGPLEFSLVGILAELLHPVVDAGISVFSVSTFDTDWILVPSREAETAAHAWEQVGHRIEEPSL